MAGDLEDLIKEKWQEEITSPINLVLSPPVVERVLDEARNAENCRGVAVDTITPGKAQLQAITSIINMHLVYYWIDWISLGESGSMKDWIA